MFSAVITDADGSRVVVFHQCLSFYPHDFSKTTKVFNHESWKSGVKKIKGIGYEA